MLPAGNVESFPVSREKIISRELQSYSSTEMHSSWIAGQNKVFAMERSFWEPYQIDITFNTIFPSQGFDAEKFPIFNWDVFQ